MGIFARPLVGGRLLRSERGEGILRIAGWLRLNPTGKHDGLKAQHLAPTTRKGGFLVKLFVKDRNRKRGWAQEVCDGGQGDQDDGLFVVGGEHCGRNSVGASSWLATANRTPYDALVENIARTGSCQTD